MFTARRSRLGLVAGVAIAALAVTGCTSGGGGADPDVETVFVEAIASDPQSLNPQLTNGASVTRLGGIMLEPLIGLTGDFELFPMLAKEWEFNDDNTELTLHLQEGVTWHDGEPFTADDVVFNFQEIMPLQTYGAPMVAAISEVEAVDDETVVVRLNREYGPLLETLSLQFILPKHVYEGTDYVTNPANFEVVGTGPLKFESFESGKELVMVKNDDYWGGDVPVDRAIFPVMPDPNTRTLALISGEIDSAEVNPAQISQIEGRPELVHLEEGNVPQAVVVEMNAQNEYLADPVVRAAVFSAIDRQAITDVAIGGLGEPAVGFFPPSLSWAVEDDIDFDEDFAYDVDAINESLDDAGYTAGADGTRFSLRITHIQELADTGAAAEQVQAMLAEIGIATSLEPVTSPIFTDQVYTQSAFDLALLRTTVSADPSLGISRWYVCNPDNLAARNPSGICDDELQAAGDGALSVIDREARAEYLRDLQLRARELIFFAPLSWTTAGFHTVNTSRWDGLTEFGVAPHPSRTEWLNLTWKG